MPSPFPPRLSSQVADDGTLITPSENIMQSCYQISRLCQMFRKAVQAIHPESPEVGPWESYEGSLLDRLFAVAGHTIATQTDTRSVETVSRATSSESRPAMTDSATQHEAPPATASSRAVAATAAAAAAAVTAAAKASDDAAAVGAAVAAAAVAAASQPSKEPTPPSSEGGGSRKASPPPGPGTPPPPAATSTATSPVPPGPGTPPPLAEPPSTADASC